MKKNYRVEFQYWTDQFMCGGMQVGGFFTAKLTGEEVTELQKVAEEHGRDLGAIMNHAPELFEKLKDLAYETIEKQMAEENYDCFDFSGPEFKGMSRKKKIEYVMSELEGEIRNSIDVGFEIPEDLMQIHIPKKHTYVIDGNYWFSAVADGPRQSSCGGANLHIQLDHNMAMEMGKYFCEENPCEVDYDKNFGIKDCLDSELFSNPEYEDVEIGDLFFCWNSELVDECKDYYLSHKKG